MTKSAILSPVLKPFGLSSRTGGTPTPTPVGPTPAQVADVGKPMAAREALLKQQRSGAGAVGNENAAELLGNSKPYSGPKRKAATQDLLG